MAVVDCLEQLLHVVRSLSLAESLVLLLGDFVEQLLAADVLHHQVDVLVVIVSLEVLDDVRVVQFVKDRHFFNDAVDILFELMLVKNFDRDFKVFIMSVGRHEHSAKGAHSQDFGFGVDHVVELELVDSLLLSASVGRNLLAIEGV